MVLASAASPVAVAARADDDPCGIGESGWLQGVEREGGAIGNGIGGTGRAEGIGGTGRSDDASVAVEGIGGTGRAQGIGGTGRGLGADGEGNGIGGTGFVGTVTAFGSICVGGARITYDPDTPVLIDGERAFVDDLAAGQVVVVDAVSSGGAWQARSVSVEHVVRGPVTAIDRASGKLEVAGQRVELRGESTDGAYAFGASPADGDVLAPGSWLKVAGVRRDDGVIVASLLTPASAGEGVLLRGPLQRDAAGGLEVAGVHIDSVSGAAGTVEETFHSGDEVVVRATRAAAWSDRLQGVSLEASGVTALRGRVATVAVEGFPGSATDGSVRLGTSTLGLAGGGAELFESVRAQLPEAAPLRVFGELGRDGRIELQRVSRGPRVPTRSAIPGLGLPPPLRPPAAAGHHPSGGTGKPGAPPPADHGTAKPEAAVSPAERPGTVDRGDSHRADRPVADRAGRPARPQRPARPPRIERPQRPPR